MSSDEEYRELETSFMSFAEDYKALLEHVVILLRELKTLGNEGHLSTEAMQRLLPLAMPPSRTTIN